MRTFILTMALAFSAFAQNQDGDKVVSVPQKYVSAEGLIHQAQPQVSQWLGWGKELGQAMHDGLAAVVDQTDRFGATRVGTFIMVMVAWKIVGKDMAGIVLGIPILIAGICIWMWALRRFFLGYRVVTKQTGFFTKEYADHEPYQFGDGEWRAACGFAMLVVICVWVGVMVGCVVF